MSRISDSRYLLFLSTWLKIPPLRYRSLRESFARGIVAVLRLTFSLTCMARTKWSSQAPKPFAGIISPFLEVEVS